MGDHQPGEKVAEGRQSIDVVNDIARKDDDVRLSSIHCLEGQKFAVADISEMEVSQDSEPNQFPTRITNPVMRHIDPVGLEKGGVKQD